MLWTGSWNPILVIPLSYIVTHHMFEKDYIKIQKRVLVLFCEICCLIELWIARVVKFWPVTTRFWSPRPGDLNVARIVAIKAATLRCKTREI